MTRLQKLLSVLAVLSILAVSLYVSAKHRVTQSVDTSNQSAVTTTTTPTTPEVNPNDIKIDAGTNYGLLDPKMAVYPDSVQYRDLADITTGEYAGYHHVMAFFIEGPGGPTIYSFISKDYKTFLLDSTETVDFGEGSIIDTQKVTGTAVIPSLFPETIVRGNFVYVRSSPFEDVPKMNELHQITSLIPGLTMYNQDSPFNTRPPYEGDGTPLDVQAGRKMTMQANIVVNDGTNLFYLYTFKTKEMYDRQQKYQATNKYGEDYADLYTANDLAMSGAHYSTYGGTFPGACGATGNTYALSGVADSDFVQIGTTKAGVALYVPKDANSLLNKAEYYQKVDAFNQGDPSYRKYYLDENKLSAFPTYEEYVAKNPLLAFKDAFGRWIGVGEFEYQLPGGCGKPVIYLYPPKPTAVSVSFLTHVKIDRAIPSYTNKWNVEAYPDGTLRDLQPNATNCATIDYSLPGGDYAKEACPKATYPYLYWSGNTQNVYPQPTTGWVVSKDELAQLLASKLTDMGLSEKEKDDMTSYWVPEMLAKNAPYYRVSFIQTKDMNAFIPMQVTPTPDTVFRIFLDWQPLSKKPTTSLAPEKIDRLDRSGFTLVEWGGLRQ
ncbi:MAG: hypothetical protein WCG55_04110 [bacterium]